MVWGAISKQGPGWLYIVEGIMNQDQYIKVLREKMVPQLRTWFPDGDGTFNAGRCTLSHCEE